MGSATETSRPAIPSETSVKDWPSARKWMAQVKALLEIHEGLRGQEGIDRFVKIGELSTVVPEEVDFIDIITSDDEAPNPPTNFSATKRAGDGNSSFKIYLSWKNPTDEDLSYVEIIYCTSNNRNVCLKNSIKITIAADDLGQTSTYDFMPSSPTFDYYFWIRAVDLAGNVSEWNPSSATAGLMVAGETSLGEWIDQIMAALRGEGAPSYSGSTTYYQWDVVSYYTGGSYRKFQMYRYVPAGITGIAPTNTYYWRITGLVLKGYVDGVATVGIDGRLVVDQTIYARSIVTDGLIVGDNITIADGAIYVEHIGDEAELLNENQQWSDVSDGAYTSPYTFQSVNQGANAAYNGLNLTTYQIVKSVQSSLLPTVAPNAAGLWLTGLGMGYHTGLGGALGWKVWIENNGDFYFGGDSNNYLGWDGTLGNFILSTNKDSGMRVLNGGSLYIYNGGDIVLHAESSNPADIVWNNAALAPQQRLRANASGHLYFYPETADTRYLLAGYTFDSDPLSPSYRRYNIIAFAASNWAQMRGNAAVMQLTGSTTPQARFAAHLLPTSTAYDIGSASEDWRHGYFSGNLTVLGEIADFSMGAAGTISVTGTLILANSVVDYSFGTTAFWPARATDETIDLGVDSRSWEQFWCYNIHETADYFFMDGWVNPDTGKKEDLDDVAIIDAIASSDKVDPVTGLYLINDDTLHTSLLSRHSKSAEEKDKNGNILFSYTKGDIARNHEGKPYLSPKKMISLLMGATRQLNKKIQGLEDEIKSLKH